MSRRFLLLPSGGRCSQLLGAVSVASGESTYVLGDPGRPAKVPTLLIAVFDNSGSVISPTGTDPLSNRFAEVAHAFSMVARKGARHELGAVLHFDCPSSGDVGPVPITKRGIVTLRRGLEAPPDGAGSSYLTPSLRRAKEIAHAHPEHQVTLVVLSDFYLHDHSEVYAKLATFPGPVHAVVLGGDPASQLAGLNITVTNVRRDDPPGAVARALFASLISHRPGSRVAADS
jgi:hypothetical protein